MIEVARVQGRSTAAAASFYEAWIDLAGHPQWSTCMEYLRLDEPFGVGARGELKSISGAPAAFEITEVVPGSVYADTTMLDGARLTVRHEATATAHGSLLLVTAAVRGERASEWSSRLGDSVQRDIEADLASLIRLLESRPATA